MILLEQRRRWLRGERVLVEELSLLIAASALDNETVLDLIYQEVLLREQQGERPDVDEYVKRFPLLMDELRVQFELDEAMQAMQRLPGSLDVHQATSDLTTCMDASAAGETTHSDSRDVRPGLPSIEGYEVLHWIGQGGMAVVFKARHLKLNRVVALKMLRDHYGATPTHVRRFLTEARAAARLQHPHIVQIYEVGRHEGRPFLAYEFLDGGTLAERISGQPIEPRLAARLVETLARTLHFAHQHGVVHRDLKPANILLQRIGESGVSSLKSTADDRVATPQTTRDAFNGFRLKIADFGLAKVLEANRDAVSQSNTKTGDILGTPAYMSPEQARGDIANLTAATDIHALGVILYELLTGRPPFVGVQPLEVLSQVIADDPVRPSQLVRGVSKDLQTICLKCLDKTPERRYTSAVDLADDLGRFLSHEPIMARRTSTWERSWRWCRRHPVKSILATSITAVLILVTAVSSVYSMLLRHQLALTSNARAEEQTAKVEALHQLWESHLSRAEARPTSHQAGQRYDGLRAIDAARKLGESIPFAGDQIDRMRNATIACLAQPDIRMAQQWHEDWESAGGSVTSNAQHTVYACRSEDREIIVRRIGDGVEIARIAGLRPGSTVTLSPDGNHLAILSDTCRVFRLNTTKPELIFETGSKGAWGFSPDGQHILGTDGNGNLSLFALQNGNVVKSLGPFVARDEIAFSPDSRKVAMLIVDSVQVIEIDTGRVVFHHDPPHGLEGAKHFAWHPDSELLAIGSYPGEGVELWDVERGIRRTSFLHKASQLSVCFGSTGELLLTYDSWGQRMFVWNVNSGEVELSKLDIAVSGISPDSAGGFRMLQYVGDARLATVAVDHSRLCRTLPLNLTPSPIASTFDHLAYSTDGRLLAVAIGGDLQIFHGEGLFPLDHLVMGHGYVCFDGDASLLTLNELGLNRWRLTESTEPYQSSNTPPARQHLTFGPPEHLGVARADSVFDVSCNGNIIAVPNGDGALIWSADNPDHPKRIGPHRDVRQLSISPDGRQLATGGWNGGNACIWDIDSGTLVRTIDEPDCCLVEFSPNGKWLVTNSAYVTIWETETWTPMTKLDVPGHSASDVCVCFSPDSSMLAVSDSTARIHLFNLVDGSEFVALTDPDQDIVSRMAFNPNGNQLAVLSGASCGVVHVWDLVALRDELSQRSLNWTSESSASSPSVADSKPIGEVRFATDERFAQLEAVEQVRRARLAAEKYDIGSARAAIGRMGELPLKDAVACNDLAWLLTTGPLPLRNAATAVILARRALLDESLTDLKNSLYLNTLGVALFRAGEIDEAVAILNRSLEKQSPESQPFDLFFLSMCHARRGDQTTARDFFNRAEALVEVHHAQMPQRWRQELAQFAEEADSMLDALPTKHEIMPRAVETD